MKRRRSTYSAYSVRHASKSPLAPGAPSVVSSLEPFFAGASVSSADAASIAVAMIAAANKDDEVNDGISFFSSSLPMG